MYQLFIQSFEKVPNSVAIILSNKKKLKYFEVNELINLWSIYLQEEGVKQEDRVGLLTENEDLYPIIHLALDKLNATIALFDTDIPKDQLNTDIKKLNLKKLLIDENFYHYFHKPLEITLFLKPIDILPNKHTSTSSSYLSKIIRNDEIPSFIVASSGSTGNKKWIPIASKGLIYWAGVEKDLLFLNYENFYKVLCTRSPAYDARISEYIRSFSAGGTLVLLTSSQRKDFSYIIKICEEEKISCLLLIASQLNTLNLVEIIEKFAKAELKHLMVTGDACSINLKKLCEQYQINLWNCYGPTEATFGLSILKVNYENFQDELGQEIVPIGLPVGEEVKIHIDKTNQLYIVSPYLSKGYIDDEDQTEKNFLEIFINEKKFRAFKSGDKFLLKNDRLIFKGRIAYDAHCKILGVKIDPYGIQRCLERFNEEIGYLVWQVFVVIKSWNNIQKPFAYVVILKAFSKSLLADFLKKSLRKEEIPIIIKLDFLPRLLQSQKVDYQQLLNRKDDPDELFFNSTEENKNQLNQEKENTIELTNLVNTLKFLWCETLGLHIDSNINPNAEFIFLGGDSFKLYQLFSKIKNIHPNYEYNNLLKLSSISFNEILNSLKVNLSSSVLDYAIVKQLSEIKPDRLNYFFLPPLLGEGYFTYKELAKIFYVKNEFNIYGLTDPSIYNENLLSQNLSDAAKRYIKAIKIIQPKGPYYLLGFSYGGLLSYHVAKELLAQNETIKALHIVDGFPTAMYQQLTSEAHANLLQELINFIIQTLNTRYYDEKLISIKLKEFKRYLPAQQIEKVFNYLLKKVTKDSSKCILKLAKQNLLLMLDDSLPKKLPIQAQLYLSSPNQVYLNSIYKIPDIIEETPECKFYFWNQYFDHIQLVGKRVESKHLELLTPQKTLLSESAYSFWERAHDPLFHSRYDPYQLKPFYSLKIIDENYVFCYICSLPWDLAITYKSKLAKDYSALNLYIYPVYDQIVLKDERQDKIYKTYYALTFLLKKNNIANLKKILKNMFFYESDFHKNDIELFESKNNIKAFTLVNLDFFWNGSYLMSLYFHSDTTDHFIIEKIFKKMNLVWDYSSNSNKNLYHVPHFIFQNNSSSIFDAIKAISIWLNEFINLCMPLIKNAPSTHHYLNNQI